MVKYYTFNCNYKYIILVTFYSFEAKQIRHANYKKLLKLSIKKIMKLNFFFFLDFVFKNICTFYRQRFLKINKIQHKFIRQQGAKKLKHHTFWQMNQINHLVPHTKTKRKTKKVMTSTFPTACSMTTH